MDRPAAQQFKDWLERQGFKTTREAAKYFGWDETYISKLLGGTRRPTLARADKIRRITGIQPDAWLSSRLDESDEPLDEIEPNLNETNGQSKCG